MTWTAGTMVNDEIRLVRPLGTGGSRVWVADQLDWKRQVAVKLVALPADADDPDALFTLLEAIAAAQVESPHLVQLFNQGLADDGSPYVLMELLAGESLVERLGRGRLPIAEATEILRQLAAALVAIHAAGQLHTGIEPASIMLVAGSGGPNVKLLNVGIASRRQRPRTWAYISPEQYLGRKLGPASDLWALGIVTYEMLTGKLPTTPESRRKLKWAPTPVSELWISELPEQIDDWFARALDARPEKRFSSAEQMLDAFEGIVAGGEACSAAEQGPGQEVSEVGKHSVIAVGTPEPEPPRPREDDGCIVIEVDD